MSKSKKKDTTATLRTILVADAARRALAKSRGVDPESLLPWSVLKESEQDQWVRVAETFIEVFDESRKRFNHQKDLIV